MPVDFNFVSIPERTIEYENGKKQKVNSFEIATACVSIDQFKAFQQATGYVTDGELLYQQDEEMTSYRYFDNDIILGVPDFQLGTMAACCMTFRDADSFCKYFNYRLPTEDEWMAASLVVDGVYHTDRRNKDKWPEIWNGKGLILEKLPYFLDNICGNITSTFVATKNVSRYGPLWFKDTRWLEWETFNRRLSDIDEIELDRCFRVCRP
ncbi:MAG: SUMF1/EgtB/PvdO family nonheme iron enzyme [Planctomycetaceae bacterium]